jgi:hypothetical protein
LQDPPGGLDLDVVLVGEQCGEAFALPVGEQVGAGVQGPPGPVQRVAREPAVAVELELDPAPAAVQSIPSEADDVERVHHGHRLGERFAGGGLEPGEPVHRNDLDGVAPRLWPVGEPGLERGLGPSFDHVQQAGGAGAVADRGEVDDDGDVLAALAGVPPVGSARGAVPGLLGVRFPGPPAEPGVRFSPHRALHEWLLFSQWWLSVSMGSGSGSRGSGTG